MSAILNTLKEEFNATDRVGVMLGPEETLEVIRVLEHPTAEAMDIINRSIESQIARIAELEKEVEWQKGQRRIQYDIIEASRQVHMNSYEELEKKDARIKHLEGIIERTKNEANLYYGTGDLLDILNEA